MADRVVAARTHVFEVDPEGAGDDEAGLGLAAFVARRLPELTAEHARALVELGGVFVGKRRVKDVGHRVQPGDVVRATVGGALQRDLAGQAEEHALEPEVLHEDEDVVVIDKPAGLLSAPTPESDRHNVVAWLSRRRPGARIDVVHRLDLQTSGVLVVATSKLANRSLSEQFAKHTVDRAYLALLAGRGLPKAITCRQPVSGKSAISHFELLQELADATLVRCRLETGRTHQIRIHAKAIGHPVLGDRRYGPSTARRAPRVALHAARLGFEHPRTRAPLAFERPLPDDLSALLERLGYPGGPR